MAKNSVITIKDLYALKPTAIWGRFRREGFAFWMICGYLLVEYVRPQSIIPAIDILPWASVFLVLSLLGLLFEKQHIWVKAPSNKWMVLYFLIILLSSWAAYFPEISFEKLNLFYTWMIIYFLIINIVNTKERLFIFFVIFIFASFKISLGLSITWAKRGFSFTRWGLMGPPGFFHNSGELAIQMAVFFPIAYAAAICLKPYVSKKFGYVLALMPVTAALTILGSSTRGGQMALIVQLVLMFYRRIFRFRIFFLVVISSISIYLLIPEEQKVRFNNAGSDNTSLQRLNYWDKGIDMMNKHPFLGVGYFNFPQYFQKYHRDALLVREAELPHNIFIQVGADLGYSGLFVYFMLIKSAFVRTNKRGGTDFFGRLPWALNISFLGFLVAGQFVSVVYYPFMWIHLALVVCVRRTCLFHSSPSPNAELSG